MRIGWYVHKQAKTSLLHRGNCCDENIKQTAGILRQPGKDSWQPASPLRCQIALDRFSDLDFSSAATQEGLRKEDICFLQRSIVSFHCYTSQCCAQNQPTIECVGRGRPPPEGCGPTHTHVQFWIWPLGGPEKATPLRTFSRLCVLGTSPTHVLCHDVLGNHNEEILALVTSDICDLKTFTAAAQ